MKTYYTFFLIVLLFQLGCEKDNIEEEIPTWSVVSAKKNDSFWKHISAAIIEKDSDTHIIIPISVANEYGFLRESLIFNYLQLNTGRQKILRRITNSSIDTIYSSYTTFMADGDVVEDRFDVLEDEDNYIDIQHLDMDKMEMDGIFQVIFVRDPNDPITNPNLPDTIRFTEGEFNLKIVNRP